MTVQDIISQVIALSGRDDLEDAPSVILGWLNRYKLYLQRTKRIAFTVNTEPVIAQANVRVTPLPDDFLFPIALRRPKFVESAISRDLRGNQFTVSGKVILDRYTRVQEFLSNFPQQRDDGELFTGVTNSYCIMGQSIVWGPMVAEDYTFYLDYYRLLPEYNLDDITEDEFTTYYHDGLLTHCLERVFTDWVYNEKKKMIHAGDKRILENDLRKYQVFRETAMEGDVNLPDL